MQTVHPLLKNYKVDVVFGGHWHQYLAQKIDGMRYVTTGGGGGELGGYKVPPEALGRFYHYLIVTVRDGKTRIAVVKLDGTRVIHTVNYELSREGIDDLKYLCKLEGLIDRAREAGQAPAEAEAAARCLKQIESSIIPNWTAYTQGGMKWPADGMETLDARKAASIGSLNALRRTVADHVLTLQAAMQ